MLKFILVRSLRCILLVIISPLPGRDVDLLVVVDVEVVVTVVVNGPTVYKQPNIC